VILVCYPYFVVYNLIWFFVALVGILGLWMLYLLFMKILVFVLSL
jgi:hypothetical protein